MSTIVPTTITTDIIQIITTQQAWHYRILPFAKVEGILQCYVEAEANHQGVADELEVLLGMEVRLHSVEEQELKRELGRYYRQQEDQRSNSQMVSFQSEDSKHFLFQLITEAKQLGSSDIHLEAYEDKCRVRMRIDGKLLERYILEKQDYPSLINKIKIQASLDIAEKRLPQDGRIFMHNEAIGKLDVRVSVLPTLHGEKVVLRLLSNDATKIDLQTLGFSSSDLENYLDGVHRPNGIVLIIGPTGSGKTTTLYATLQLLNKTVTNIVTIEDPIEYTLEGINQVQLRENIGLDFPSAMRTFLRQDPDIIMVGEIRDKATAEMAIRASLTGHLVMSTIHTNSAWGIISRLLDMGTPSYLLADTLNTAVAQRLVRQLCPHCKEEQAFDTTSLPRLYKAPRVLTSHFIAHGCAHCFYTGYKGRRAIYEVISIDQELAHHIKNEEMQINPLLEERGIHSLADNAFHLLERGVTSLEEVYAILASGGR